MPVMTRSKRKRDAADVAGRESKKRDTPRGDASEESAALPPDASEDEEAPVAEGASSNDVDSTPSEPPEYVFDFGKYKNKGKTATQVWRSDQSYILFLKGKGIDRDYPGLEAAIAPFFFNQQAQGSLDRFVVPPTKTTDPRLIFTKKAGKKKNKTITRPKIIGLMDAQRNFGTVRSVLEEAGLEPAERSGNGSDMYYLHQVYELAKFMGTTYCYDSADKALAGFNSHGLGGAPKPWWERGWYDAERPPRSYYD